MSDLQNTAGIIEAGKEAGDTYTESIDAIHEKITDEDTEGAQSAIGEMVGASLELTEAQITKDVTEGTAKAAMNQVKAGAGEVKKSGG